MNEIRKKVPRDAHHHYEVSMRRNVRTEPQLFSNLVEVGGGVGGQKQNTKRHGSNKGTNQERVLNYKM